MELRSGRRLRSSQQQPVDHISGLPDDLLLLILARLPCTGAAVRTGVLSRRWRNLWRLLSAAVFRDVKYFSLEPALACVSPEVSLLEIHVPRIIKFAYNRAGERGGRAVVSLGGAGVSSLLRAAARLEPEGFVFALGYTQIHGLDLDLPCFHRATSITLEAHTFIRFHVPLDAEFAALETLSLSGYNVGLDALIRGSPRLRVLRLKVYHRHEVTTVSSPSLQELFVDSIDRAHRVDIDAPMLRHLAMSLRPSEQVNISISAPMVETISWRCSYYRVRVAIGRWRLRQLTLHTAGKKGQLPSLHIHASICVFSSADQRGIFKQEIKKHMIAAFSALELHLITSGHLFGIFVFHLIRMKQIRSSMRRLKVILRESQVKENCPMYCRCHPTNWVVQTIPLIALEEIQIEGFEGEEHDFEFLKSLFMSAPMLKRVIVNLAHEDSSSGNVSTKLYDLFRSYSAVECCIYLSTGEYMSCIDD